MKIGNLAKLLAAAQATQDALPEPGESKPWWKSRTLIGALVVMAASLVQLVLPEARIDVNATTEALLSLFALIGGIVAWWGRMQATRPVRFGRAQALPAADDPGSGDDLSAPDPGEAHVSVSEPGLSGHLQAGEDAAEAAQDLWDHAFGKLPRKR